MNDFYIEYCHKLLLSYVPEIKELKGELYNTYQDHLDYDSPLITLIFEDVVCPYFMELIRSKDKNNINIVCRISQLIEKLLESEDFDVRCVGEIGFLEKLVHDIDSLKELEIYLLPKSLKYAKALNNRMYGRDWSF